MGHMKNFLFLLSFLSFCLSAAPTPALLFKINGSVVKVHVANKDGHHGVGSGVVVAKDHVVTNCHVIANAKGVHVTKFGKSHAPHSLLADWKNDLPSNLCLHIVPFWKKQNANFYLYRSVWRYQNVR